ncbi:MAG: S-layer homology domain-containing protein, partial [Bacillota bacterium]
RPITITADSNVKAYDGTELTDSDSSLTAGTLAGEDAISSVKVVGSQTEVGSSANVASAAVIMDGETNVTSNYAITYVDGTLEVTAGEGEELSITGYSGVYDSDWHTITVENVVKGDTVYYSLTGNEDDWFTEIPSFKNVTVTEGAIVNVKVTNPNYEDRTGRGTVTIKARPIEITADSASKTYDGTALTANTWKLTSGTLATGGAITSVTVTGSQITVGESPNVPSAAKIMERYSVPSIAEIQEYEGIDVTSNYAITYVNGMLTVTSGGGGHSHKTTVTKLNTEDHFAYIQGYPDDTVRPQGNVTREEVAAVFYRLLDSTYRDKIRSTSENFSDIDGSRWSLKHIGTLSNGQIITGYPDGSFRPGKYITRAELAAIAARFDDLSVPDENKFSDITGHWAEKYILSAAQKGWVSGYPDGTFRPDQYITRAEFVTLVNNVLNRDVELGEILSDAKKFSDLEEGKWYYQDMEEAINSHNYERKTNGSENWTKITSPSIEM